VTAVLVVVAVAVLAAAQLLLPGITARSLRDRLAQNGEVISVRVSAFPAIELLWLDASRVTVRLRSYRSAGVVANSLDQISGIDRLDVSVGTLKTGALTMHDVTLRKRGDRIVGHARIRDRDLRAALPLIHSVTPVRTAKGGVVLRGRASVLGIGTTVDATLQARHGRIVVVPNVPFSALATVTVFSDSGFDVRSVHVARVSGGLSLTATGVSR